MSFHEMNFSFDNRDSTEFPIYIVHMESGMVNSEISGSRSLVYDKISYKDSIYFYGTTTDTMKFSITITPLERYWTEQLKFDLFKWLGGRTPKAFRTCDFLGKMCYCICTNAFVLTTNSTKEGHQGYIDLEFEATTPYWLTEPEISTFDLSTITSHTTIILQNKSNVMNPKYNDYIFEPEMWIDLKDNNTGISIVNISDGGRTFSFTGLSELEQLYINNDKKQIISSTNNFRFSKFNKNWFRLTYGENQLLVSGKCMLQFKCQFPVYI